MRRMFVATVTCIVVVIDLLSGMELAASRQRAIVARDNLSEARSAVHRIASLRKAPRRASLDKAAATELTRRIEQAASTAVIDVANLIRIEPREGRRIRDTDYLEQPTFIELRSTTLNQLVSFINELTVDSMGLQVTSLRVTAPRATTSEAEVWDAEVTLTNLVYSLQSRRPRTPQ